MPRSRPLLADHVQQMGFTHIQLMPLAEHPDDDSLGYEPTGFFAPSARYGTPQDLMSLVDQMHQRGIGVILEWAIGSFPLDAHGPVAFDGQPLYETADTPAIDSSIPAAIPPATPPSARFDLKNRQVQNFLLSSALFWLDRYHLDGIKVAGLEDLLYPEAVGKGRSSGPLETGDRHENPEAVSLLRILTDRLRIDHPGTLLIAEDNSYRRQVARPIAEGGLGFDLIDSSRLVSDFYRHYLCVEPGDRPAKHDSLTTVPDHLRGGRLILPFTYRETGGPKTSAISKLPGDDWKRFANMRLLLGFLYTLPAKKAIFMGAELGSRHPWNPASSLDWHLRGQPRNKGLTRWLRDLNTQYRGQPALHAGDCQADGFAWLDQRDDLNCVVCYVRRWRDDQILVVCNFKTKPLHNYRVGAPVSGDWEEILNSDAPIYGGSGQGNLGGLETSPVPWHGHAAIAQLDRAPSRNARFQEPPLVSDQPSSSPAGAFVEGDRTRFRVWAPTANHMRAARRKPPGRPPQR